MTKKDYIAIAKVFENCTEWVRPVHAQDKNRILLELAKVFKQDNSRFDYVRFFKACNSEGLEDYIK